MNFIDCIAGTGLTPIKRSQNLECCWSWSGEDRAIEIKQMRIPIPAGVLQKTGKRISTLSIASGTGISIPVPTTPFTRPSFKSLYVKSRLPWLALHNKASKSRTVHPCIYFFDLLLALPTLAFSDMGTVSSFLNICGIVSYCCDLTRAGR